MAVAVYNQVPQGIAALEAKIGDRSLPLEVREGLWLTADHLSRESSPYGPRGSRNSWEELLGQVTSTTTITGTSSETIMVPDITLPANYLVAGRSLKYTVIGDMSSVITTPGTWTFRLRYGGVGGTILAASGAFAPDPAAAGANVAFMVEWYMTMRADGVSGSAWVQGRMLLQDWSATAATLGAQMNMTLMPVTAPAAVTINTTTANALSPTSTASLTTGSLRTNMAYLEALN